MNITPTFRFIATIFVCGLVIWAFSLGINALVSILDINSIFWDFQLKIWNMIGLIVMFFAGLGLIMDMQKRRVGN